jgi:4-amino-4-deoxy-L-arabinose transferase-like glycosyltransferase
MLFLERHDKSRWLAPLLLLFYSAFFFLYGLGAGELYRNETLRAIIAKEMLRTGDWIVPTLYGEPLFTKPPGMYMAIALCSWPSGEVSESTARLPSALAATAIVFLMYWFFATQLDRRAGLLAALLVPMSAFWLERSTSAEIDMLLVAWVTASILFFLRALPVACGSPLNGWWVVAALVCVACGTLTKWTAPAFFYGTAIPLLWWRGQLRLLWSRQHLLSAFVCAGIVLSWIALAVLQTSWTLFYDTVSREAWHHLASASNRKGYPWLETLLHPLKMIAVMLPWSAVGLLALRPSFMARWDEKGRFLLQALHCWAWPNLLFWSFASDHAPRHSAPLFPALSGLAAMVCIARARDSVAWRWPRLRPARILAGSLAIWMIVKVLFIEVVVPLRLEQRHTRAKGAQLSSLIPLNQVLYLFKLKDEGIMFYFGRPAVRLADADALPSGPVFCILTEEEWSHWGGARSAEVVQRMQDAQGDNIVLVCLQ